MISISTPAKINRYLAVAPPGPDGYHPVVTLVQHLALRDEIEIRGNDDGEIRLSVESPWELGPTEQNLAWRAAHLLREKLLARGVPPRGADLLLQKQIPVAAGLGGGSSDAAAVLVALNALWRGSLSAAQLGEIGQKLGADVPALMGPPSAWYGGVGEVLLRRERLAPRGVLLVKPEAGLSTPAVYRELDRLRDAGQLPTEPLPAAEALPELIEGGRNDLAAAALSLLPELSGWLDALRADPEVELAQVSGSGPTLFALTTDRASAEAVLARLPFRAAWALATSTTG